MIQYEPVSACVYNCGACYMSGNHGDCTAGVHGGQQWSGSTKEESWLPTQVHQEQAHAEHLVSGVWGRCGGLLLWGVYM